MISYAAVAEQVVERCARVQPGERVWIDTWEHMIPLASELAWACRRVRAHPLVTLTIEDYWWRSVRHVPQELVAQVPVHLEAALEETDVYLPILGPPHPIPWDEVPRDRRDLANIWHGPFVDAWHALMQKLRVRRVGVEAAVATPERAQSLGVDYTEWHEVMFGGCLADYESIAQGAQALVQRLQRAHEVQIQSQGGTALRLRLAGYPPDVADGICSRENPRPEYLPSGYVEVAVDDLSAEGTVAFDSTVLLGQRRFLRGLSLRFEDGRVAEFDAAEGRDAFVSYWAKGEGVDRLSYIGFGLNSRLRHGFTQDDKVAGGVTIGLGDNTGLGGRHPAPDHFWASLACSTVHLDGAELIRAGTLVTD